MSRPNYHNLLDSAFESIPDVEQWRVIEEDEQSRIVWDARWGRYALVRRCGMNVSFVCLGRGFEQTAGWFYCRGFDELERPNGMYVVQWMRAHDTWAGKGDRRKAIRNYVDETLEDFDKKSLAKRKRALAAASDKVIDRYKYMPRSSKVVPA